jgi:hypothetical protein
MHVEVRTDTRTAADPADVTAEVEGELARYRDR